MDEAPAPATPPPARTIGERLRAGRERSGLSVAAAAEKLHLDPKVIESLEADRYAELGGSVYVRGHLRRYADFVGEPGAELVEQYAAREARPPPPDLTRIAHAERRSDLRRLVTPFVGLGAALVVALAIWLIVSRSQPAATAEPASSNDSGPAPAAAESATVPVSSTAVAAPAASTAAPMPAAKSTPADVAASNARDVRLKLELTTDSWVEIYDARGQRLFYDIARAGTVQSVSGRGPLRVELGNAAGVAVEVDGQTRDIPKAALEGEGARFVVNRSGSLSRARP